MWPPTPKESGSMDFFPRAVPTLVVMMNDEMFFWYGWQTYLALFSAGTIARDPHYCESPTRR